MRRITDLPVHPSKTWGTRDLANVTTITVHHSAGPESQSLEAIATYHIETDWGDDTPGAPGIAYHVIVLATGEPVQVNDLAARVWHDGKNDDSVGICVLGNFAETPPRDEQVVGLRSAIASVKRMLERANIAVVPHGKRNATRCPGTLAGYIADTKPKFSHETELSEWYERRVLEAEGEVFAMRKAVDYSNALKAGMEHWLREIAKILHTPNESKEQVLSDLLEVFGPADFEEFLRLNVIEGSRGQMAKKYGPDWE